MIENINNMIYNFYSDNMEHKKGLTLIELLAVIAILGVLVVFAVPNVLESYRKSRKHSFVNEAKTVYSESVNKFAEQRTQGKKINLVSNDEENGFNLNLQNEKDLKYTVRMDNTGSVTSFKLSNSEFCIVGVGDFLDKYSIDEIIELKTDEDKARCNITTFKDGERLTINLNTKTKDYPIETEHNPKKIYLKFNDDWYDEYNRIINKIEIPKKVNYYFDGFSVSNTKVIDCEGNIILDNVGTGVFDDGVKTSADAYSTFSKKCITIKYNGGSGTSGSMENTLYCYGDKTNLSENRYTKNGYIFKGWNGLGKKWNDQEELPLINDKNEADANLTNFKFSRSSCNQANIVKELNAVWEAIGFKVTLVADHKGFKSNLTTNEITVTYDGTYSNLPTPSISGYTFEGWYTAETGGTIVNKTDKVNILNDIILYAHYKPNKYGLDINPDFNLYGQNYNAGAHVESFDIKAIDENGNVLFDKKGVQDHCSLTTSADCKHVIGEYNATYYITNVKYRDGYKYKDYSFRNDSAQSSSNLKVISANGTSFTFKHIITNNMWFSINTSPVEYLVKYNANGGSSTPKDQTKVFGQDITITTSVPSISGYAFNGWKDLEGTLYSSGATYNKNKANTLTAQWCPNCRSVTSGSCSLNASTAGTCSYTTSCATGYSASNANTYNYGCTANTFTVAYNGNGGSNIASHNCTYNSNCNLTTTVPSRSGYTFGGWRKNNTGTVYGSGASVKNAVTSGTATYYAQWCPNCRSVTGGSCSLNVSTAGTCSYTTSCATGYTSSNTNTYNYGCTANTFTIAYNGNGGSNIASHNCTYNSNCNLTTTVPSRGGYKFLGWRKNNTGTVFGSGASVKNVITSGTVTYYAQWEKLEEKLYDTGTATTTFVFETSKTDSGYVHCVNSSCSYNSEYYIEWNGNNFKMSTGRTKGYSLFHFFATLTDYKKIVVEYSDSSFDGTNGCTRTGIAVIPNSQGHVIAQSYAARGFNGESSTAVAYGSKVACPNGTKKYTGPGSFEADVSSLTGDYQVVIYLPQSNGSSPNYLYITKISLVK